MKMLERKSVNDTTNLKVEMMIQTGNRVKLEYNQNKAVILSELHAEILWMKTAGRITVYQRVG